ncbi:MAG TPA: glycosyltransferase, partial [Ktedonobacteraceae bacterium]
YSIQSLLNSAGVTQAIESGRFLKHIQAAFAQKGAVSGQLGQDVWQAAQGAEAIIYKNTVIGGYVYSIAETLGIPCAEASFLPVTRTREFPPLILGKDRGPLLNWLLGQLIDQGIEQVIWQFSRREVNRQRRDLLERSPLPFFGPSAQKHRAGMPIFYAYSPLVLPRPADWPDRIHVPGYWVLDSPSGWQPPAELLQFLEHGPAPVYIGFGSMPSQNSEAMLEMILQALQLAGQRGILLSGWAGIGKGRVLPEGVLSVENIPHEWLFPRMAALVHHGGAGTTGAALRSGVPSIVTPFFADQPFWAWRVHTLGVGSAPLPHKTLTAQQLANAINEAVTNTTMRKRAAEIGRCLQAEDGLGRTIEIFLQYVDRRGSMRKAFFDREPHRSSID